LRLTAAAWTCGLTPIAFGYLRTTTESSPNQDQTIFFLLLEFIFFMENTLLMSCFAQSGPAALVAFLFSPPPGHKDRPNKELKITRRSNKTRQKEEEGQQQKQEQLLRAGSWELSSKSTSLGARSTTQLGSSAIALAPAPARGSH
jgi:hypothetical protein